MTLVWDPDLLQYRRQGKFAGNNNTPPAGGMNALQAPVAAPPPVAPRVRKPLQRPAPPRPRVAPKDVAPTPPPPPAPPRKVVKRRVTTPVAPTPAATEAQAKQARVDAAMAYARAEMDRWGLQHWTLKTNTNTSRLGVCRSRSKTIEISSIHAGAEGNEETIRNTARHEIAHALHAEDPNRRTNLGHGAEWRAWAVKVGANPKSSSHTAVVPSLLNYDKRHGQEIIDPETKAPIGVRFGDVFVSNDGRGSHEITILKRNRTTVDGISLDGKPWRISIRVLKNRSSSIRRFDVDGETQHNPHVVSQ